MKGSGFNAAPPKYYWRDKVLNAGCLTTFNEHAVVAENRLTKINNKKINPLTSLFGCTMSTAIGSVKNLCKIKNENKVLIDYFNSMYIDCINFSKNIANKKDDNQCDFIKEKINNLTQTQNQKLDNSKLRHHIIYAVAK